MILTDDQVKNRINKIESEPFGYFVVERKSLKFFDEEFKIKKMIEVNFYMNMVVRINEFYKTLEVDKNIDISVLNSVTNSIVTNTKLSNEELNNFLQMLRDVEVFDSAVSGFYENDLYLSYDIIMMLFGVDLEAWRKLGEFKKENYTDFIYNCIVSGITIKDCISKMKKNVLEINKIK